MKPTLAGCTIVSNNFLAGAQVLAESFRRHHPGSPMFACIVDEPDPTVDYGRFAFQPIFAGDLGIPQFRNMAFRYGVLELNTAVKPFFFEVLRDRWRVERVAYFDADVLVHDRLLGIEDALDRHCLALTPHITAPLDNDFNPAERKIRSLGIYNLGFLALRLDGDTASFLRWWAERLHRFCVVDPAAGLFVDQSWMDFAPAFLDRVAILRDPIYNIAYWNLPQRHPRRAGDGWEIDGRRVGFFHFSGLALDDLSRLSKHQDRIRPHERHELRPLLESYRSRLEQAGLKEHRGLPYSFDRFRPAGPRIPAAARQALRRVDPQGRRWPDPFDAAGPDSFLHWLTEPVQCAGGTLNRLVLALWEERSDLVHEFPYVCGSDLWRFEHWLNAVGASESALPPELTAAVVPAADPQSRTWRWSEPRWAPLRMDAESWAARLARIMESSALGPWLSDPIPGTRWRRPVLRRAALLLHEVHVVLQRRYPDPLGGDQRPFGRWFGAVAARARRAARRETMPPVVVIAEASPPPLSHRQPPSPRRREGFAPGCNLFSFGGGEWAERAVITAGAALEAAAIPGVAATLDGDSWGRQMEGRLHQPAGVPFGLTVLATTPEQTREAVSRLPVAATATGPVTAWWTWPLAHFPTTLADRFACLTEVWAPSRFCAEAFAPLAGIPVQLMPPCLDAPRPSPQSRAEWGLEEDRFYFFARCGAGAAFDLHNPYAALAALRALVPRSRRAVGLVLAIAGLGETSERASELREASRDLPVTLVTEELGRDDSQGLMARCDAALILDRGSAIGLAAIDALSLGRPVIATGHGGMTDFLDEATGFPVPWRPGRLDRDLGAFPRGALWAEPDVDAAAAAMISVLDDSEEAQRRTRAGARRVELRFRSDAAAGLIAAIHRLSCPAPQPAA